MAREETENTCFTLEFSIQMSFIAYKYIKGKGSTMSPNFGKMLYAIRLNSTHLYHFIFAKRLIHFINC